MENEQKVSDIKSLVQVVLTVNESYGGQVWWRGQRNHDWKLTPSIMRHPNYSRFEDSLIARFKHKAPSRHPNVPMQDDYSSWLFLMQHYRLPTRLLDWTESPLAAAFFGSEIDPSSAEYPSKIVDKDGALFAISPYALNETQTDRRILYLPSDAPAMKMMKAAFGKEIFDSKAVLAIRPSEVDMRLMVQLAVFTLHGSGMLIEDILDNEQFLLKFRIPSEFKQVLRSQLKQLGIRESSLFPDLEHLAKDVASTWYKKDIANKDSISATSRGSEPWGEPSS